MEDCSVSDKISEICWFCKKGRHHECMKEIPVNAKSEGPHAVSYTHLTLPTSDLV